MTSTIRKVARAASVFACVIAPVASAHDHHNNGSDHGSNSKVGVELGPRPFHLVDRMKDGRLKRKLQSCQGPFRTSHFSIGHRGAGLQFPEHTKESYMAAARMGAGILECDVTFTRDAEFVCRHAQCDLHTTTNILATPLASKCKQGFKPAVFDPVTGEMISPASAKCCTSDLTLAEFKSLKGKMDASDPRATTVAQYMGGTPDFRTDLYATGATVMSHKESIALFNKLGVDMTPELKGVDGAIGFDGVALTQETYARKMLQEYIDAGISPKRVWAQSFDVNDIKQWIGEFPRFGRQAVYLVDADNDGVPSVPAQEFGNLRAAGVNIIAPPMPVLLTVNDKYEIVPSAYAKKARWAGLDIISWTSERSGRIVADVLGDDPTTATYYYSTTAPALKNDGDILTTIDVLAQKVGIIGLFSDWPATTTFYANCMGLK
jgi:glycerophosphoryl diester phosphodiesterase